MCQLTQQFSGEHRRSNNMAAQQDGNTRWQQQTQQQTQQPQ